MNVLSVTSLVASAFILSSVYGSQIVCDSGSTSVIVNSERTLAEIRVYGLEIFEDLLLCAPMASTNPFLTCRTSDNGYVAELYRNETTEDISMEFTTYFMFDPPSVATFTCKESTL